MGCTVLASDVRAACREQVTSIGGQFVEIEAQRTEASQGGAEGRGGYASETSEEFHKRQLDTYLKVIKTSDIVITTAMIPNKKAPVLITKAMVGCMKPGSIIIDLAAQGEKKRKC